MSYLLRLSACLFLCVSLNSFGASVSFGQSYLLDFNHLNSNDPASMSLLIGTTEDSITAITYFPSNSGYVEASFGNDSLSLDWSDFNTYSQSITNLDENTWGFSLFVEDSTGEQSSTASYQLATNEQRLFSTGLNNLNSKNNISKVWVEISNNLPLPQNDSVLEYRISYELSEVPLPAGIYLFLSGLVGLVGVKLRGRNA